MNLGGQQVDMFNAQHHLIGAVSRTGRVMLWHSAICGGFGDNNPPDDNGSTAGDRRNYTSDAPAVPTGFDMGATKDIALGHEHACVIRAADASVHCWGRNVEGQIGNGTPRHRMRGRRRQPQPRPRRQPDDPVSRESLPLRKMFPTECPWAHSMVQGDRCSSRQCRFAPVQSPAASRSSRPSVR